MCGSTEIVKQNGFFVCQTCGTKYSVEEAKQMMTSINVNGDNATVVIGNKNPNAMIEKGRDIINVALEVINKEDGEELMRLSTEILDIDSGNFYGQFFSFASKFALKRVYDVVDFSNAMERASAEEKSHLLDITYSSLHINLSTSLRTLDDDDLIAKDYNLLHINAINFLSYIIKTKETLVFDYSAKFSELQDIVNAFIERCFLCARNVVKRFIFTEQSVEGFEFTNNICTMISKLSMLSSASSELIYPDSSIYTYSKDIFNIISSNAAVISKNQICSKTFFEELKKLPGVDETHEISNTVTWQITNKSDNVTVIFDGDTITIKMDGSDDRVIKAKDVLKINSSCRTNDSAVTQLYDIVYLLNENTFTIVRLEVEEGDIYSSVKKQDDALISWSTINYIDFDYENWEESIPLINGFNGLEYIDTLGCEFQIWLKSGNFFKLLRDELIFLNPKLLAGPKTKFKYTDIAHVKIKESSDGNTLIVYTTDGLFHTSALVSAGDLPRLNGFVKMLIKRAKTFSTNYSDTEPENAKNSGGCYVATCVYGSYDCPEVWTLRRYRDDTLGSTWYGRLFIRTYYAISPTLVRWFGNTNWFKKFWKGKLDRIVKKLQNNGVESTPYNDKNWK